ncbi:MAG: ShlB/FhaC/HecB family hemolysin secretion/activation protein [Rhodocyclaceae bacterium]|nr:ShlB/FhaC/HecB family hemolysin secretion/activation protein [Rhodocyclaceae bacterium]MCA3139742.1 ShlB/FhaC/HecB family hemolysin secretion/activation protein [Rhodocyclaceae bacterium]MCA3153065.1 ShlB/FhaC/HecB family hemolysin secretion/activation protein [Rhodocyclaceae bacterium]MCA3844283.1 ShlB/FhaC/HecB family hemolysin secretion/activation protein [Burkholderia sp.]
MTTICPALAQVGLPPALDPGVLQQREIERERRQREEELRQERNERPVAPQPQEAPRKAPVGEDLAFFVREIRFDPPSAILKPEELEQLAAGYRGRSLRLADLRELVARINALYRERNIATAQATLPAQDVTDGVVVIRLVEARLGQLQLRGNATTNDDYISNRIGLKAADVVDLGRLERDLVLFNRTNDAQLRAELQPGTDFGRTDIVITVVEPRQNQLRTTFDNTGSSGTGEYRLGTSYVRRSLTGRRDDLFVSVAGAEGHLGKYITYGVPVGYQGTRVTVGYFEDSTRVVNGSLASLRVTGEASAFTGSLRHPLISRRDVQVDVLLSAKKRRTVNWIDGTVLSGSDLVGYSGGLDVQVPLQDGYWTANVDWVAGENVPIAGNPRSYHLSKGTIQRSVRLSNDFSLSAGLSWQYTTDTLLPSSEQMLIGGEGTVRGYATGLLAGDRGVLVNMQMFWPVSLPVSSPVRTTAFAFVDYGEVQPFRPTNSQRSSDVLSSVGTGLNFSWGRSFSGRVSLGLPLNSRPEEPRDYRFHFSLAWTML